jgi:murein DD-endopeptidase MepM/ murein hydrolase activator NlpD
LRWLAFPSAPLEELPLILLMSVRSHVRSRVMPLLGLSLIIVTVLGAGTATATTADQTTTDQMQELETEQDRLRDEEDRLRDLREQARANQDRIDDELQDTTARLDALQAQLAVVSDRADRTADKVRAVAEDRARQRDRVGQRVRELYKSGAVDPLLRMLTATSREDVFDKTHYLSAITGSDMKALEALAATSTRIERQERDLARDRRRMALLESGLEDANAKLEIQLAEAVAAEERALALVEEVATEREQVAGKAQRLRDERAAQARARQGQRQVASRSNRANRAPVVATGGGKACPQARPRNFTDTWGAPRSGGRRHQGTDIMGVRGGNVYAITSGTAQFTKTGAMSGLFLSLRGDDGNTYWYMHLQDFVVGAGQRVEVGQLIAHNGDTGNARGTTPHIHFELHPGGGGAVNPYATLRSVCG